MCEQNRSANLSMEQNQLLCEQHRIRSKQDQIKILSKELDDALELRTKSKDESEKRLLNVLIDTLNDIIEYELRIVDRWLVGMIVRVGNLNELMCGDRDGFGKDGSLSVSKMKERSLKNG